MMTCHSAVLASRSPTMTTTPCIHGNRRAHSSDHAVVSHSAARQDDSAPAPALNVRAAIVTVPPTMSPIFKDRPTRDPKKSQAYSLAVLDHARRWDAPHAPAGHAVAEEREATLVEPGTDPNSPDAADTGQRGGGRVTWDEGGRYGKVPEEPPAPGAQDTDSVDTVSLSEYAADVRIHVRAHPNDGPRRPSLASISSSYSEAHTHSWRLTAHLAATLFCQSLPSILLSLFGLILSGQLLDHLARWPAFEKVDELFILFPVLSNLKGNLETCLGARLGTAAAQGLLDRPASRRARVSSALVMLQFQALAISALAGLVAFFLGLTTDHRVADPAVELPMDGEVQLGYTRPGLKELGFVITVGMLTASLSSGVLGSFMTSLVVLARWIGVDPGESRELRVRCVPPAHAPASRRSILL